MANDEFNDGEVIEIEESSETAGDAEIEEKGEEENEESDDEDE